MRKRLRKKKILGEFTLHGFPVRAELHVDLGPDEEMALADRLIACIEARQLGFGGNAGSGGLIDGFIAHQRRQTATEADRDALDAFLDGDDAVARHVVGPLRDAWR